VLDDELLVLGTPTYAWTVEAKEAGADLSVSQAVMERFVGASSTRAQAQTIPPPPAGGPVRWIHGARLADGRVAVVMEATESDDPEAPSRATLYSVLGEEGWDTVEELPPPAAGELLHGLGTQPFQIEPSGSEPLRSDGHMFWGSVLVRGGRSSLALYRRGPSGWTGPEIVDASPNDVAAVRLPTGAPVLVVTGLHAAVDDQRASLRLYRDAADSADVVWVAATDERFHALVVAETAQGPQAAWIFRDGARRGAWVIPLSPAEPRIPMFLDADAAFVRHLGSEGNWAYWTTSATDGSTGAPRLRIHRSSASATERIADLPSPFVGLFSGTLSPTGEIVVVGPEAHFETTPPFVRSLVLRFSLSCDS